jgi:hypothetical protein
MDVKQCDCQKHYLCMATWPGCYDWQFGRIEKMSKIGFFVVTHAQSCWTVVDSTKSVSAELSDFGPIKSWKWNKKYMNLKNNIKCFRQLNCFVIIVVLGEMHFPLSNVLNFTKQKLVWTVVPTRHLIFCWSNLMLKSDQKIWYEFDRYISQTPIKNLYILRSKFLIGEYGGFWLEFDQYTDRTAYQIPFKFSYQKHIRSRSVCLVGKASKVPK